MGLVEGLSLAPLAFVMTAIVFRAVDPTLDEAARIGGASVWQTLRRVTIPLAWPGVLAASLYIFTIGFGTFDVPAILGLQARIFTFSTYVFMQISPSDGLPEYGGVATLSVFMLILALGFSAWYSRVHRQAPRYAVVTGKAYRPALIKLGRFRWLALTFVVSYLTVSQLLPILTLLWSSGLPFLRPVSSTAFASLSLKNFHDLPEGLVLSGLGVSAALMLLVPTITLTLSVALSWVVLRSRLRWRALFDFFAFLPHAVPKIVFSVAAWLLALFVLRDILPIYGTIWILVPVYVVATLSYGTRMINGAFIQIHRELEESAMVAGAGLAATVRAVLLPLLRPAILYAWIWIALLSYRELTIPVVLSTNDNQPLSVIVWSLVLSNSSGQASAVAVTMLALMLPVLFVYATIARRAGITRI
jgi:iron(III) transport system permease protein